MYSGEVWRRKKRLPYNCGGGWGTGGGRRKDGNWRGGRMGIGEEGRWEEGGWEVGEEGREGRRWGRVWRQRRRE